eukprot:1153661-Pelagomonas_calceolata.AAC.4
MANTAFLCRTHFCNRPAGHHPKVAAAATHHRLAPCLGNSSRLEGKPPQRTFRTVQFRAFWRVPGSPQGCQVYVRVARKRPKIIAVLTHENFRAWGGAPGAISESVDV